MHSAVMQNKKYIKFADQNSVEVLSLSRLDEAVKKGDAKAATYRAKGPDGQDVDYMVEWPNLTLQDITTFRKSKAATYNDTGGIPQTMLIDPYTEERVKFIKSRSAKGVMEEVAAYKKDLIKRHGKAKLKRKDLRTIDKADAAVSKALAKNDLRKAVAAVKKIEGKSKTWPDLAKAKVQRVRQRVTGKLSEEFNAIQELAEQKPKEAKRKLSSLMPCLQGTDLHEQAAELMEKLKAGNE